MNTKRCSSTISAHQPDGHLCAFMVRGKETLYSHKELELVSILAGDRGSTVVMVLCYKSEGDWFDSRWCHWNSSLT